MIVYLFKALVTCVEIWHMAQYYYKYKSRNQRKNGRLWKICWLAKQKLKQHEWNTELFFYQGIVE